jgi:nucleoside-diphosphate-sugar epimerase
MNNKILIVGGTGFIGYHLAKKCLSKNMQVTSLSVNKPKKSRYLNKIKYLQCKIENKKELIRKLKKKKFDFVVNLGGYVDHNNIRKTYASHYIGCKNLVNFFQKKKIKLFLQIGSSAEYGKTRSPHTENSKTIPVKIYGQSKLKSSLYLMKLYKKSKFPITILRLYQIYGPNQDTNRLIPIVINACLKNKKFLCSNGLQRRDFLYVEDLINCFLIIFKKFKKANGKIFNVGFGKSKKIKSIIKFINKKLKGGKPQYGKIRLRIDEPKVSYPNISLIKKTLNWQPKTPFLNGLKTTMSFYNRLNSINNYKS